MGDYVGLSRWTQCNYKGFCKRGQKGQSHRRRGEDEVKTDTGVGPMET